MDNARQNHMDKLQAAREELRRLKAATPHRRDLLRHVHRMEKELKIYDHYRSQRG